MSVEIVKEFFKKIAVDKELQTKIKKIDNEFKESYRESYSDSIIKLSKIGKEEGFIFTSQDIIDARNVQTQLDDDNISRQTSVPLRKSCTEVRWAWEPEDPPSEEPSPPTTPPAEPEPEPGDCVLFWS